MVHTNTLPVQPKSETPDFHSACWRAVSQASALGCLVSYLPRHEPVPLDAALVGCLVCADRWLVTPAWLPSLRRTMLALALAEATGAAA